MEEREENGEGKEPGIEGTFYGSDTFLTISMRFRLYALRNYTGGQLSLPRDYNSKLRKKK